MAKLTIVRGVSGSGKSTWAELQPGRPVIVSRDRIRMAMFGTEEFIDEDLVTVHEHNMIRHTLRSGRNVISDNTNCKLRYVNQIVNIAEEEGASVEIKTFDVSLGEAIRRNAARAASGGRDVPVHVIERQYADLQKTLTWKYVPFVIEPYEPNPELPPCVLYDIDGTAAHMDGNRGPFDWAKVGLDRPDQAVKTVVNGLRDSGQVFVFAFSGRDGVAYGDTERWLVNNNFYSDGLFMREPGDMRPDNVVKLEMFNKFIRPYYNCLFVIDDRAKVVRMWKRLGIKVFNVAGTDEGEF